MNKQQLWKVGVLVGVMMALLWQPRTLYASTDLPPSAWYAVVWNASTDTLHWLDDVGEQASMARPKLPNEGQQGATVYISPNGQTLVIQGGLQNGRDGLGFYDLASGQFTQVHEAQPDERIIIAERNPFTLNSEFVALGFASESAWRVIVFETATGNAVATLDAQHPTVAAAQLPPQAVPSVAFYDLEQNFGAWRVHVRFVTLGPNIGLPQAPSLAWIPAQDSVSLDSLSANISGFDVLPQQSRMLFSVPDSETHGVVQSAFVGSLESAETLYDVPNALPSSPRWVANGLMVAFRVAQQPFANLWHIAPSVGGESIPFAPDYDELLGTSDGFLLVDYEGGEIRYSNTLQFEAFTPSVGNLIYSAPQSVFRVVYVTPMGATFTLSSLADGGGLGGGLQGGANNIQAPTLPPCGTAPAPRLTVGQGARVTFTNGTPLNLRSAPNGEVIMQLSEGTQVNVIGGAVCENNFYWWNVQLTSQNVQVGGWAAEGTTESYFLEPFNVALVPPLGFAPTSTPALNLQAVTVPAPVLQMTPLGFAPTSTPALNLQAVTVVPNFNPPLGLAPTSTPAFVVQVSCPQSPPSQLQVGIKARTINPGGGTLAMRINLTDEFPTYQVPAMQDVDIIGGSQCREGIRMWQVATTLNGQAVVGWIAEGYGQLYYMLPK